MVISRNRKIGDAKNVVLVHVLVFMGFLGGIFTMTVLFLHSKNEITKPICTSTKNYHRLLNPPPIFLRSIDVHTSTFFWLHCKFLFQATVCYPHIDAPALDLCAILIEGLKV